MAAWNPGVKTRACLSPPGVRAASLSGGFLFRYAQQTKAKEGPPVVYFVFDENLSCHLLLT